MQPKLTPPKLVPLDVPWGLSYLTHHVTAVLADGAAVGRAVERFRQAGWLPEQIQHFPPGLAQQTHYARLREQQLHERLALHQPEHPDLDEGELYAQASASGHHVLAVWAPTTEAAAQVSAILAEHGGSHLQYLGGPEPEPPARVAPAPAARDPVAEASVASFPASDPPASNAGHA
jgi:hypothetical protein